MKKIDIIVVALVVVVYGVFFAAYSNGNVHSGADNAVRRIKAGDYSAVEKQLMPLAKAGDSRAQFNLGVAYMLGQGLEQDFAKSFIWTRSAAQEGDTRAQVNLANLYMEGHGVEVDTNEAIKWYTRAASGGDGYAALSLGRFYRDGKYVPQDMKQARIFFNIAADAGSEEAKNSLAALK